MQEAFLLIQSTKLMRVKYLYDETCTGQYGHILFEWTTLHLASVALIIQTPSLFYSKVILH